MLCKVAYWRRSSETKTDASHRLGLPRDQLDMPPSFSQHCLAHHVFVAPPPAAEIVLVSLLLYRCYLQLSYLKTLTCLKLDEGKPSEIWHWKGFEAILASRNVQKVTCKFGFWVREDETNQLTIFNASDQKSRVSIHIHKLDLFVDINLHETSFTDMTFHFNNIMLKNYTWEFYYLTETLGWLRIYSI